MSENEIQFRLADWATDKDRLGDIRRKVFIEEQNVPEALEWDEFDETATHFIATQEDKSIACARLKTDGQIGRMAVLAAHRHRGIGSRLLELVLYTATEKQYPEVYLHSQVDAIPFYAQHGFTAVGDIFYEANIPHRGMFKKLC